MHMSDHLKQQIKAKMQERVRIEAAITECSARLEASGVGLKSKLVDAQVLLHWLSRVFRASCAG